MILSDLSEISIITMYTIEKSNPIIIMIFIIISQFNLLFMSFFDNRT